MSSRCWPWLRRSSVAPHGSPARPGGEGFTALELHELEVREPLAGFDAEVAAAEQAVRDKEVADTAAARALYRSYGIDPTRHRPSSEALLRRVRRGDGLPRIN